MPGRLVRRVVVCAAIFAVVVAVMRFDADVGAVRAVRPYLTAAFTRDMDLSGLVRAARSLGNWVLGERARLGGSRAGASAEPPPQPGPHPDPQPPSQRGSQPASQSSAPLATPASSRPSRTAAALPASRARVAPVLGVPVHGPITYGFGQRIHPIYGQRLPHEGIDIAAPEGTPVLAAAKGSVARAGPAGAYGMLVELDHGAGFRTLYAHCSRILVRRGDLVRSGQKVAEVGSTGVSTGPHLHFEVVLDGRPRDPLAYLPGGRRDAL